MFSPISFVVDDDIHNYPSSSHYTRNWDKVAKDFEEEEKKAKPEGDAAVNDLFQKIYSDGSEEVKKAMNKSFVSNQWLEGGLSTSVMKIKSYARVHECLLYC